MKKLIFIAASCFILAATANGQAPKCGQEAMTNHLIAVHPEYAESLNNIRASLQQQADDYAALKASGTLEKTTVISPIPVIFHIIVNNTELTNMGGMSGITARVDSQIAVLNRDYNRGNGDSTLIPAGFKARYTKVGIQFGKAKLSPGDTCVDGYELKIISADGFTAGNSQDYSDAKHLASGGLDGWDHTKYLNVWVIGFSDNSSLLGITTPPSFVNYGYPASDLGVCINYLSLGVKTAQVTHFVTNITKGRTLTHEFGHYFGLSHVWGDDGGLCPNNGGQDDGIADTPPQADATYGSPALPKYDDCTASGTGIICMDYMDYTDDAAMQMFTTNQGNVMAAKIIVTGESYSLTQHPELLVCVSTSVNQLSENNEFTVSPNPATGIININFGTASDNLKAITVVNIMGQEVKSINTENAAKAAYSIDLSGMSKGMYFVQCRFATGNITKKVILQ